MRRMSRTACVAAVVLLAGMVSMAGDPPQPVVVEIEATVIEISGQEFWDFVQGPDAQTDRKRGDSSPGAGTTWQVPSERLDALKGDIETGRKAGRIVFSTTLSTVKGKTARHHTTERVKYFEKLGEDVYRLKTAEYRPVELEATPAITADGIAIQTRIQLSDVQRRLAVADAPEMNVGKPDMTFSLIVRKVVLRDGAKVILCTSTSLEKPNGDTVWVWIVGARTTG